MDIRKTMAAAAVAAIIVISSMWIDMRIESIRYKELCGPLASSSFTMSSAYSNWVPAAEPLRFKPREYVRIVRYEH